METGRATDAPFVVALDDSIIGLERQSAIVRRMADAFDETHAAAVIALEQIRREDTASYGIVLPRDGGSESLIDLADLVEKPRPADAPSTLAIAARYVLSPQIFAALERTPSGAGARSNNPELGTLLKRLIKYANVGYMLTPSIQRVL